SVPPAKRIPRFGARIARDASESAEGRELRGNIVQWLESTRRRLARAAAESGVPNAIEASFPTCDVEDEPGDYQTLMVSSFADLLLAQRICDASHSGIRRVQRRAC